MAIINGKPANETPGLYFVRLREPDVTKDTDEVFTWYVDGPSLEAIITALGGRFRDGGPVVWGGRVLPTSPHASREPDLSIIGV